MAANQRECCAVLVLEIKISGSATAGAEAMPKESVEELLRRLVTEDLPEHLNARYVLAILLERKRTLKQVDIRESAEDKIPDLRTR